MAKAKKRVAVRKKSSKPGKASAKPRRKAMARHTTLKKKAKSKVQPTGMNAKKPTTRKKRSIKTVERPPVAEKPVETTTIDIIEESASSVVGVTQYESVQATTPIAAADESKADDGIAPAGTLTMAPDSSERPEHDQGAA